MLYGNTVSMKWTGSFYSLLSSHLNGVQNTENVLELSVVSKYIFIIG